MEHMNNASLLCLILLCTFVFVNVNGAPLVKKRETGESTQSAPAIEGIDGEVYKFKEGIPFKLDCTASGNPTPTISFRKSDGKDLAKLNLKVQQNSNFSSSLVSSNGVFHKNQTGTYICKATNEHANAELHFVVQVGEDEGEHEGSGNAAPVAVILTSIIMTVLVLCVVAELYRRRNSHGLSANEIELFRKGKVEAMDVNGLMHENIMYMPFDEKYEINESQLKLDSGDILGSGMYGMVIKGRLNGTSVAVKTVKPGASKVYLKALLSELKIMVHIGKHPYISQLVGACSQDLGRGMLKIVVELYSEGNLEKYLRNRRNKFLNMFKLVDNSNLLVDFFDQTSYQNAPKQHAGLTTRDLIIWSYQIADGMSYLGSKNVIHADLATRNILLDENRIPKITDFGLSRKLYNYSNYVKKNQEPLPWRWMAIESLKLLEFSPESDVWAFGVLIWEMFTLGEVPYPNESWSTEFVEQVVHGMRLLKPKYANDEIYENILLKCWKENPKERITFMEMATFFQNCSKKYLS